MADKWGWELVAERSPSKKKKGKKEEEGNMDEKKKKKKEKNKIKNKKLKLRNTVTIFSQYILSGRLLLVNIGEKKNCLEREKNNCNSTFKLKST